MYQEKTIPIFLRDVYGTVDSEPLYQLEADKDDQDKVLFLRGDNIADFILANRSQTNNKVVTLVIEGLTDVYWERREMLGDEVEYLKNAIDHPPPYFNLFCSNLYEMEGSITPYNIVYIGVDDFIHHKTKFIRLAGVNVIIKLV